LKTSANNCPLDPTPKQNDVLVHDTCVIWVSLPPGSGAATIDQDLPLKISLNGDALDDWLENPTVMQKELVTQSTCTRFVFVLPEGDSGVGRRVKLDPLKLSAIGWAPVVS
jgi:hypothetical protein